MWIMKLEMFIIFCEHVCVHQQRRVMHSLRNHNPELHFFFYSFICPQLIHKNFISNFCLLKNVFIFYFFHFFKYVKI